MKKLAKLSRRARWAVPAGTVVAACGSPGRIHGLRGLGRAVAAAPTAGTAGRRGGRNATPPLAGTVVETASLGLPALPSVDGHPLPAVDARRLAHDRRLVRGSVP